MIQVWLGLAQNLLSWKQLLCYGKGTLSRLVLGNDRFKKLLMGPF